MLYIARGLRNTCNEPKQCSATMGENPGEKRKRSKKDEWTTLRHLVVVAAVPAPAVVPAVALVMIAGRLKGGNHVSLDKVPSDIICLVNISSELRHLGDMMCTHTMTTWQACHDSHACCVISCVHVRDRMAAVCLQTINHLYIACCRSTAANLCDTSCCYTSCLY